MGFISKSKAVIGTAAVVAGAAGSPAGNSHRSYVASQQDRQTQMSRRVSRDAAVGDRRRAGGTHQR
jgi:hypothetical protein